MTSFWLASAMAVAFALWFVIWLMLVRPVMSRMVVITPFLYLAGSEIGFHWVTAWYSLVAGIASDGLFLGLVLGAFGSLVAGYVVAGGSEAAARGFVRRDLRLGRREGGARVAVLTLLILMTALAAFRYRGLPPLWSVISDSFVRGFEAGDVASFMSEQRFLLTKAAWFGGEYRGQVLIADITAAGYSYLLVVCVAMWKITRRREWMGVGVVAAAAAVFALGGDGTRAPVLWALVVVVIGHSLVGGIRRRTAALVGACGFLLLFGMSAMSSKGALLIGSSEGVRELVGNLGYRVFVPEALNTLRAIEFVRSGELEHEYGMLHFQKIVSALPGVQYGTPFSYRLHLLEKPESRGTTFASSTYMARCYVDFGIAGVLLLYIVLGAFVARVSRAIFTLAKTPSNVAVMALVTHHAGMMFQNGFDGFAASMVPVAAIHITFIFLSAIATRRSDVRGLHFEYRLAPMGSRGIP